MRQGTRATNN